MLLLNIQAKTTSRYKGPRPFLGGALHGMVEHVIRQHAPHLMTVLAPEGKAAVKRYAIIPPPFTAHSKMDEGFVSFAIILFGEACSHVVQIAQAMLHCQEIKTHESEDFITEIHIYLVKPGQGPQPLQSTKNMQPQDIELAYEWPSLPEFNGIKKLSITWLTPVTLINGRQNSNDNSEPHLFKLVSSVYRRICELAPDLGRTLGHESPSWNEALRQIYATRSQARNWRPVYWQYGSSTKQRPFKMKGMLGQIEYESESEEIPDIIIKTLHWGMWFGIGQKTTIGHGFYDMKIS